MKSAFLFATIYIVDTDVAFVQSTRMVLQNAGYIVRGVRSGRPVLPAILQEPPDLILVASDFSDGIDSYTLVRELKAATRMQLVPLVVLADNEEAIANALNAGADEFLRKPVTHAELLLRVRAMLRLKRTTDVLADLNATLERRVVERTQALEQAHERLRHGEKLAAMGRLAASVAHDINNPISGIMSYLYLIKQDMAPDTELAEDLTVIERQVNIIAKLVRRLQNFSRPPRLDRFSVQVLDIVEDVLALTRKDLEKRHIDVVCNFSDALPSIQAAPDQISEVCMNLIVNARDAMGEQGGTLRVDLFKDTHNVVLRVADTGTGIPDEIRERIFEPFFTTKGEQGTGLGLAICYRIVQEHKGDIIVESEAGKGTTFSVYLPFE